ncbi:hypothetical protein B0T18DRAFT_446611 [Schizothecium vesticola]|uniref:Uncharacterized protein n=1 Tax=Schizothecium vesticola TaxID=314040 RepID=A0AA40K582_9PEZI|nr:hypothetical protein B0T18DRAFT_446611 [Schizothecium vesticola]
MPSLTKAGSLPSYLLEEKLSNKEAKSVPSQLTVLVLVNPGAEDTSPLLPLTVPDVPKPSHLSGPHSLNPHYEDDLRADAYGIDAKATSKARSMAKRKQQETKFSELNTYFAGAVAGLFLFGCGRAADEQTVNPDIHHRTPPPPPPPPTTST